MTALPRPEAYVMPLADRASARPLTLRQLKVLRFIYDQQLAFTRSPTLREIGAHMSIRSTNGVNDHLLALERKGCIVRDHMLSRAIYITPRGRAELGYEQHVASCPTCGKPR